MKNTSIIKNKKGFGLIETMFILVILLVVLVMGVPYLSKLEILNSTDVQFSKCIDGDTAYLTVEGKEEKVRFLAIDTPETVKPNTPIQPFGKEASEYTCKSLMSATNIELEYEPSNKVDKYNRKIAWVFVDGTLLQKELLANGLAKIKYERKEYKYIDELFKIEESAKAQKIGIWQ